MICPQTTLHEIDIFYYCTVHIRNVPLREISNKNYGQNQFYLHSTFM